MRVSLTIVGGLIGLAALACSRDSGPLAAQPAPVVTQPQPPHPPQPPPPPGARRIELGSMVRGQLTVSEVPAGCPATSVPGLLVPCRHFEVVAPRDGVLRVQLDWIPQPGAEAAALLVAGVDAPHASYYVNPQARTQRVLAGTRYGVSVVYWPSHFDYLLGPDLIGEFRLEATFEG
jgi:hypothetical protein